MNGGHTKMKHKIQYIMSVLSPETIAYIIHTHYSVGQVVSCSLLRSYVNDVYDIKTQNNHFIGKLYRERWRDKNELQFELEFISHIHKRDVSVSLPVSSENEDMVIQINTAEGLRYFVLYDYAQGSKPQPPFNDNLYFITGYELAKLHKASLDFSSKYTRSTYFVKDAFDASLTALKPYFNDNKSDWMFLLSLIDKVKNKISVIDGKLTRCVCHGDYSLDNLHFNGSDTVTLYDFDVCGYGYTAYDLLGAYQVGKTAGRKSNWEAHLCGYREAYQLSEYDIEALPYLLLMYKIWALGCRATLWVYISGTWQMNGEKFDNAINDIRQWADSNASIL